MTIHIDAPAQAFLTLISWNRKFVWVESSIYFDGGKTTFNLYYGTR